MENLHNTRKSSTFAIANEKEGLKDLLLSINYIAEWSSW